VAGRPLLQWVVERAKRASLIDQVVVATTDRPTDDALIELCSKINVPCFRGSENDVLDRFYQAARTFGAEVVVRITADCPVLDSEVIDKVVRYFLDGDYDYVSNGFERTYPDGLDTEVFRFDALERAWREADMKSEREHVTLRIWQHPEWFKIGAVKNDQDLSSLRWTVDEPEDLQFHPRRLRTSWTSDVLRDE